MRRPFAGPIALNADAVAAAQEAMHTAGILERERANREMKERVQKATTAAIAAMAVAKKQQLSSAASSSSSCFDLSSSDSDSECEIIAPADPVTGVIVSGKQKLKNRSSKAIA
jgi:hypothetical protein